MNPKIKEELLFRLGIPLVLLLIAALSCLFVEIFVGFPMPTDREDSTAILIGSIVASAVLVLFTYAKITDNWDAIVKKRKKRKLKRRKRKESAAKEMPAKQEKDAQWHL